MGNITGISWCDKTWNIARGCEKVDKDCLFCYMYRESFAGTRYNPREVVRTKTVFYLPDKIKKGEKSQCWDGPVLIFNSSLSDWGLIQIDSYRPEMWDIIRRNPQWVYQLLTKRIDRDPKELLPPDWGDGWDHVWIGTSVGHDAAKTRLDALADFPAKTKFVSFEPYWQPINFRSIPARVLEQIDWSILGGESGNETGKYRYRPCEVDWLVEVKQTMESFGSKIFVKQLGTHIAKEQGLKDRHGRDINEFPPELQVQEFPHRELYAPAEQTTEQQLILQ